jgi:beta-galactosidase
MNLGVCYQTEHGSPAAWAADARRMVDLGLTLVRIGESAWSRLEPSHGRLEFGWLDDAVDTLARAGLQVVMCTPTAAPPKWLVDRHPSILALGADGRPRGFGSRRHYDFSSEVYFEQARRITTQLAQRYGRHPAVQAWQVDHQYGAHDTVLSHSASAVRRFRLWLRERYASIEQLNEDWGNGFRGMEYTSFDEIDAPAGAATPTNPAHRMDFRRFASDEVRRFNRMQCEILREQAPGRPLMHGYLPFATGFDPRAVAADLDVAGWDSAPLPALEHPVLARLDSSELQRWVRTGHPDFAAFHHDLCRGMSAQPFWVTEQQPGPSGLGRWNPAPAAGMVRLWTWEAFAHGAGAVNYARWRQLPFAQEQMHAGLLGLDGEPDAGAAEVAQVHQELQRVPAPPVQPARVALVLDHPACWALQAQPHGADADYLAQAFEAYMALRALGLDVDIVAADAALAGYALVVVPSLPIVPPQLLQQLRATQAQLLLYPRCGSMRPPLRLAADLPPGVLHALIAVRVTRVESLPPGAGPRVGFGGTAFRCMRWRETLRCADGVQAEAGFDDDGGVAVALQGRVRYLAGEFEPGLVRAVLARAARDAGLAPVMLPPGLRWRRRGELLFVFNHGSEPQQVDRPGVQWLVGDARVAPQGVSIGRTAPG